MRAVRETKWFLPGVKSRILAFSDLHFSKYFGVERLGRVLNIFGEVIEREKIEYICFLGDLVDSLAVLDDDDLRQKLCEFLKKLGESLPVIIVLGNHDYSRYEGKKALLDEIGAETLRKRLRKIPGVYVLGEEEEIFDDGRVRMMGVDLPEECYHFANFRSEQSAEAAFREKMIESLPKLEADGVRERYLLLHSSRFLREINVPKDVIVLSGHMHDGATPPFLDKVLKFSGRGLIGPGYIKKNGKRSHYEVLPWNARLRPRRGRIWLSLRPVTYLPRNQKIGKWNRLFPDVSYTIIRGGTNKIRVTERMEKF